MTTSRFISAVIVSAFLALGAIATASAQDRLELDPEDAVSSQEIRENGFVLMLSDGTEVRVTNAAIPERPRQNCLVHIPSLRTEIERGLRAGDLRPIGTAAQEFTLNRLLDDQTGETWCVGAGTGCNIIIY
jgi:hypothetical protein